MPDHVAELGKCWDHEGADHELRAFEEVDVTVADVEEPRDIGQEWNVVALQDAAGELDQNKESNDPGDRTERDFAGHETPSFRS